MDFFTDWQEFDAAGATVKFYKKSIPGPDFKNSRDYIVNLKILK